MRVSSNLRFCFDDTGLCAVMPLDKSGVCDTPACSWTTTEVPENVVDFARIHLGMRQIDYLILCGYPPSVFDYGPEHVSEYLPTPKPVCEIISVAPVLGDDKTLADCVAKFPGPPYFGGFAQPTAADVPFTFEPKTSAAPPNVNPAWSGFKGFSPNVNWPLYDAACGIDPNLVRIAALETELRLCEIDLKFVRASHHGNGATKATCSNRIQAIRKLLG